LKKNYNVSELKVSKISLDLVYVDSVLDRIRKLFPKDLKVHHKIAVVQDALFQLEEQLRGLEIEVFAAPWVDPDDDGFEREGGGKEVDN
jgi:hypothetical protein